MARRDYGNEIQMIQQQMKSGQGNAARQQERIKFLQGQRKDQSANSAAQSAANALPRPTPMTPPPPGQPIRGATPPMPPGGDPNKLYQQPNSALQGAMQGANMPTWDMYTPQFQTGGGLQYGGPNGGIQGRMRTAGNQNAGGITGAFGAPGRGQYMEDQTGSMANQIAMGSMPPGMNEGNWNQGGWNPTPMQPPMQSGGQFRPMPMPGRRPPMQAGGSGGTGYRGAHGQTYYIGGQGRGVGLLSQVPRR